MPPTPALVEPKREPAATPFLEEIFRDLPILEDGHPGHPWFRWTEALGHPLFQIYDGPRLITLPYVRYQETNGDTYLVGTEGQDQSVHYRPVHLGPAAPVEGIQVDDNDVGFLTEDPTFNFALAQALEGLNNPGTLAEVSRFRILTHQINAMQGRGYYLERLANEVREMQRELTQESAAFRDSILKCRERLVAGKVRARVIRTLQRQAARGLPGSRFYSMENGPARRNIFDDANLVLEGSMQGALDVSWQPIIFSASKSCALKSRAQSHASSCGQSPDRSHDTSRDTSHDLPTQTLVT